jgi:hypothetical protein
MSAKAARFYRKPDDGSDYEVLDTRGILHIVRQPSPWSLTASFGERLKGALMSLLPASKGVVTPQRAYTDNGIKL